MNALSGSLHLQLSPSSPKLRRPNPSLSTRPNPSLSSLSSSLSISLTERWERGRHHRVRRLARGRLVKRRRPRRTLTNPKELLVPSLSSSSAPSRSTAARALVDTAVRSWRIKYPTSKNDDCTVVCLFLQDDMEDAGNLSVSISNKEEEEEDAIVQVKEESISKSCGIESKMMTTMTLAGCISVAQDDEEWSALEGLTRTCEIVHHTYNSQQNNKI
ncbi:hypothetical protein Bca52824_020203 [Brassica carinata]|uniref:Uncharacterized protein n=1 Tax=Brassica carinata TaxID=52824 RepID=A0A8X7VTD9_BRACI|nr:hypothetical protein Bca52824_020203 [Brassica carinata]